MPTRRGWGVVALGLALLVVGRALGVKETMEVGVALILLWGVSALTLMRERPAVAVRRDPASTRLHLGETVNVQVSVTNDSDIGAPGLTYEERLPTGTLRLRLPPVRPHKTKSSSYAIVPSARGVTTIGPGHAYIEDPFGLARRTFRKVPADTLIVYPAREQLLSRRGTAEAVAQGIVRAPAPATTGAEFYTIREHQHGDDLRKVHWVSTARSRRLMIRQEEQHRHTSISIFVDDEQGSYDGPDRAESFERCLVAAASIADLFLGTNATVELVMKAAGTRSRRTRGTERRHTLMEMLARADLDPGSTPFDSLVAVERDRTDHAFLITPRPTDPTLIAARRRVARLTLVLLEQIPDDQRRMLDRAGIDTVVAYSGIAAAWNAGTRTRSGVRTG